MMQAEFEVCTDLWHPAYGRRAWTGHVDECTVCGDYVTDVESEDFVGF